MFQSSPINFLDLCNKLDLKARQQYLCPKSYYVQLLRFFKQNVYARSSICAKISDDFKNQACFDDTAVDVLRYEPTMDQLSSDWGKLRCSDDELWRTVTQIKLWNDLPAYTKSVDLRRFVAAPIPKYHSLLEFDEDNAPAPPATKPVSSPAVSAVVPVPPPAKN